MARSPVLSAPLRGATLGSVSAVWVPFGKKAAAKYKPGYKEKTTSSRLSAVVVDGGKPDDKLKDAGKMVGIVNFMQNGKKNGSKDMV